MGGAIVLFYLALERLPLALAASIQFLGPLAIALMTSRKPLDAVLACVASIGVWLLVFEPPIASLNLHGVAFAFGAAGCWAAYIGFARLAESTSLFTPALALLAASLVLGPFGALEAGQAMASSHFLPLLVALAVLSAAIPVTLELFAVPRMPVRSFATLMSCEPVLAACAGAALLGEYLSVVQSGGIALIAGASIGVVMRSNLARSSPACAEAASRIHADRHIPDATRCAGAGDRRSNSRVSGATDAE